ncbi:MAG: HlyD family efflux transporter periplasmic adaptor subunit [Myxococcales bacterium]|nr:HlyD family efflux transporter periplasmic adaptor subunit [Myxococcales bacterium]
MRGWRATAAGLSWIAAVAGAGVLWWQQRPAKAPLVGMIEAATHVAAAPEAGRVQAVLVEPGQPVTAGQALARLRTDDLDAELAVARAELAALVDRVEAEGAALRTSLRQEALDTQARLAQARAHLADVHASRAVGQAEREALVSQLDRLEGALQAGLTAVDHLTSLRARERALAQASAQAPRQVAAWRTLTEQVEQALAAVDDASVEVRLKPLSAEVEVQRRRLEGLLLRREARVLRASVAGRVAEVRHRQGDAVTAGEPVITLRAPSDQVVAWSPTVLVDRLEPGQAVEVRARRGRLVLSGRVERLGPAVEALPAHLWRTANQPAYGRPAYVRLDSAAADLVAGEPVQLVLRDGPAGAQAADKPAPPGPRPLAVPEALSRVSRFEPSGGVWLAELGAALVVSDDTGLEDQPSEDRPWVFRVDHAGQVSPAPVPIEGLEGLGFAKGVSDLESATRDPAGDLWLLASNSLNKKGKRKPKRQPLIRARWGSGRLHALAAAPLFEVLSAGLTPAEQDALDVEAMTWADGGLLLGLKAPLGAQGGARLWRIADPAAAAAGKPVPVTPVAELVLPTGADGAPGGFSELLLEGSTLWATSTLAAGPARGCLWRLPWPLPPQHRPEPVACWPDLKPEGLLAGPQGVMVLFDSDPPRWVTVSP